MSFAQKQIYFSYFFHSINFNKIFKNPKIESIITMSNTHQNNTRITKSNRNNNIGQEGTEHIAAALSKLTQLLQLNISIE